MLIQSKPYRRKTEPFSLLLVVVALGMCVTLTYQVVVYYGVSKIPIARQTPPPPPSVGG